MERRGGKMGSGLATLILDEKKITWKVMCKCERQMRKIWKVLRKILYPPLECFFMLLNLFFGAHTWKLKHALFLRLQDGFNWMDLWLAASTVWLQLTVWLHCLITTLKSVSTKWSSRCTNHIWGHFNGYD